MREFFKPWRRKIGVMTLVMACLTASIWVRGLSRPMTFEIPRGQFHFYAIRIDSSSIHLSKERLESGQISFSKYRSGGYCPYQTLETMSLPHWPIVVPLTLVSAYLLLSKPKPNTAKIPSDA